MFKFILSAMLAAATVASVFTVLTATSDRLDAGPLPAPAQEVLTSCTQQPWPYLNCVGTPFGNPHIRLIATGRQDA
jgi:guanyl-specific ribonuclease Sa